MSTMPPGDQPVHTYHTPTSTEDAGALLPPIREMLGPPPIMFPLLSRIVGGGFIKGRVNLASLPTSTMLVVLHEPTNPYDPNALKVWAQIPEAPEVTYPLGYVPAATARDLIKLLHPGPVDAAVSFFPARFAISPLDTQILIEAPINSAPSP